MSVCWMEILSFKFEWSLTISLIESKSFIHSDDLANRKIFISNVWFQKISITIPRRVTEIPRGRGVWKRQRFCPDVFVAVDGDERQRRFHNFGCLVTRLNLKSMFHTWNMWPVCWKLLRDKKNVLSFTNYRDKAYNFIEVFLVKDKSRRDICLMLKKNILRDGSWFPLIS